MADDERAGRTAFEAAGLYDPGAPDAGQRLALLEYLVDLGATIDDLVAEKPDQLAALASVLTMWPDRETLTLSEAAARTGMDRGFLERVWRAAGFPVPHDDDRVIHASESDMWATLSAGVELFGEDVILQLARVLGTAAARVADTAVSGFIVNIAPEAMQRDPSGLALARANAEATQLLPFVVFGFDVLLRHHIVGMRRFEESTADGIDLSRRSVGFVDLVGSTELTEELDMRALATLLGDFDATASEIVIAHGCRLVKMIGDEIMFVSERPADAVAGGLALIEAFENHRELPPVRGAVATGSLLVRSGDYAGRAVNLAARAVKIARPSTLLVDGTTAGDLPSEWFACDDTGRHRMKGFASPIQLFRVRENSRSAGTPGVE